MEKLVFEDKNIYGHFQLYTNHIHMIYKPLGMGDGNEHNIKYSDIKSYEFVSAGTLLYKHLHLTFENADDMYLFIGKKMVDEWDEHLSKLIKHKNIAVENEGNELETLCDSENMFEKQSNVETEDIEGGYQVKFKSKDKNFYIRMVFGLPAMFAFLISLFIGFNHFIPWYIVGVIVIGIPVLLGGALHAPVDSFNITCPYCKSNYSGDAGYLKYKCPSCNKIVGYKDGKVYKITSKNKKYFETNEEEIISKLLKNEDNDSSKNQNSNLKQLKELKELLDMNAITEEEYNKKKKELLK